MSSITTYIQDNGILGNIILFLSGKDATSFVGTCQQLSKILPYEYCYFSYSRKSNTFYPINTDNTYNKQYVERVFSGNFKETDVNKLKALLRNPSFTGLFLVHILSIFTRENKQTMAYLVLDDPRLEIEQILEHLRGHLGSYDNYLRNDSPEMLWLLEHPRVKEKVRDCGNCEIKLLTKYSSCPSTDCGRILCPLCLFTTKCSGFRCKFIRCVECQNKNCTNKMHQCPATNCVENLCLNCQRDEFCKRCKINRLCPFYRCSHRGLCGNCNYETHPDDDSDYYDEEKSSDSNSNSESESDSSDSSNDDDDTDTDTDTDTDADADADAKDDDDDENKIPSIVNGSPPGMGLPQSYTGLLHHFNSTSSSDGGNDENDNIGDNKNKSSEPNDVNRENDGGTASVSIVGTDGVVDVVADAGEDTGADVGADVDAGENYKKRNRDS